MIIEYINTLSNIIYQHTRALAFISAALVLVGVAIWMRQRFRYWAQRSCNTKICNRASRASAGAYSALVFFGLNGLLGALLIDGLGSQYNTVIVLAVVASVFCTPVAIGIITIGALPSRSDTAVVRCQQCGYPISNTETCTECGANLAQVGTLLPGVAWYPFARRWSGRAVSAVAFGVLVAHVAASTMPMPVVVEGRKHVSAEAPFADGSGLTLHSRSICVWRAKTWLSSGEVPQGEPWQPIPEWFKRGRGQIHVEASTIPPDPAYAQHLSLEISTVDPPGELSLKKDDPDRWVKIEGMTDFVSALEPLGEHAPANASVRVRRVLASDLTMTLRDFGDPIDWIGIHSVTPTWTTWSVLLLMLTVGAGGYYWVVSRPAV